MCRIKFFVCFCIFSLLFFSCATNSDFTDTLSVMSQTADNFGFSEASVVLDVSSKVSKSSEAITPEDEYYIGRSVAATVLQSYKMYENPTQELYVNKIAQALVRNSAMPELYNGYHVKILDSEEINAFSTSGGHIFVTKGLIRCIDSEDALAAVIAHEIAHIQLKHSTSTIKASRWTDAEKAATNAVLSLSDRQDLADVMNDSVGEIVNQLILNGYSKEQEFQADEYALGLMAETGYNPEETISLLNILKDNCDASGNTKIALLKTHPEPEARIEKASEIILKNSNLIETSKLRTSRFKQIMNF